MGRRATGVLLGLAALAAAAPAGAQQWAVEVRGGGAVGSYTATDAGLDVVPQLSFGATVERRLMPMLSAYVGFSRSAFGCEEGLCTGRDVTLTSQAITVGGRYALGPVWGRAGLAMGTLQVASDAQTETHDMALGWDLAAGASVPLAPGFSVRPGITYVRHGAGDGHVALLAAEVGVVMRF